MNKSKSLRPVWKFRFFYLAQKNTRKKILMQNEDKIGWMDGWISLEM